MAITSETLSKLAQFDTPTICNVIELFDVRPRNQGYMDSRIRSCFPDFPPMVGFACTTTFRSDAPAPDGSSYGDFVQQLERFSELPGPAVMVFQDMDDPPAAATFGEVMCSSYQAFGSAGLITSGAGRDLEQVRALKYPTFTGSTNCSHAYCHFIDIAVPVRVGGLMVRQGDLLHGDANGVSNIPIDIANEVADAASEFVTAEEIVMGYVKAPGDKSIAEWSRRRKEFEAAAKQLRERVQRA